MVAKQIIVATDVHGSQAIYADGAKVYEGDTASALDIGNAAGRGPISYRHVNVDLPEYIDGFPETLDGLRPLVSPVEEPIEEARTAADVPLPCPFCGGSDLTLFGHEHPSFKMCRVWCRTCEVGTPCFTTREAALAWWSRRAFPVPALQDALWDLNELTNPLLDVDPMDLHRARVKAQKVLQQCGCEQ